MQLTLDLYLLFMHSAWTGPFEPGYCSRSLWWRACVYTTAGHRIAFQHAYLVRPHQFRC